MSGFIPMEKLPGVGHRELGDAHFIAFSPEYELHLIAGGIRRIRHRKVNWTRRENEAEDEFINRVIDRAPRSETGELQSRIFICFYEGQH